jgi:FkbM family methyltransferase
MTIRGLVTSLGLGEFSNLIWSEIYPYTGLRKKRDIALRKLLSNFVNPNSLVLDVGASKGLYTELFLTMGARVLSIEPNPRVYNRLVKRMMELNRNKLHEKFNVSCLNRAIGSFPHVANYYIGEVDGLSSLSLDYIKLSRWSAFKWKKPISVFVDTLDNLSKVYGIPDFIKIDVEGYEVEVIKGMNFAPKALSFEFIPEDINSIEQCVQMINKLGNYYYTYTIGLEPDMRFEIPWDTSDTLVKHISCHIREPDFGDVWVKKCVQ